jgi:hypothetical protein
LLLLEGTTKSAVSDAVQQAMRALGPDGGHAALFQSMWQLDRAALLTDIRQ